MKNSPTWKYPTPDYYKSTMHHPSCYALKLPLLYIDHSDERAEGVACWMNLDRLAMLTQRSRIFGGRLCRLLIRGCEAPWCCRVGYFSTEIGDGWALCQTQYQANVPMGLVRFGCCLVAVLVKKEENRIEAVFSSSQVASALSPKNQRN